MTKYYWYKVALALLLLLATISTFAQEIYLTNAPQIGETAIVESEDVLPPNKQVMYWVLNLDTQERIQWFGTPDAPLDFNYYEFTLEWQNTKIHRCISDLPENPDDWDKVVVNGVNRWQKFGDIYYSPLRCEPVTLIVDNFVLDTIYVNATDTVYQYLSTTDTIFQVDSALVTQLQKELEECQNRNLSIDETCANVFLDGNLICRSWAAPNPVGINEEVTVYTESYIGGRNMTIEILDPNGLRVFFERSPNIRNYSLMLNQTGVHFGKVTFEVNNITVETPFKILVQ